MGVARTEWEKKLALGLFKKKMSRAVLHEVLVKAFRTRELLRAASLEWMEAEMKPREVQQDLVETQTQSEDQEIDPVQSETDEPRASDEADDPRGILSQASRGTPSMTGESPNGRRTARKRKNGSAVPVCSRCERRGHLQNTCWSRFHKDGSRLDPVPSTSEGREEQQPASKRGRRNGDDL